MKKLVTIVAIAAAAATLAQAQTNQVLSRNAVGYVKIHIPPAGGFNLVCLNFNAIGGTNTTLNDILATQLRKGALVGQADKVYIYDPNLLTYVQYACRLADTQFHNALNFNGPATNPILRSGQAFWIASASGATTGSDVYIMGEVPDFPSNLVAIAGSSGGTIQQIGNPYPVDMNVNALINTNDGARSGALIGQADRLYVWDESITNYIQLALRTADNQWHYSTNFNGAAPTVILAPGDGAWYQAKTNFIWAETKPYTYP